MCTVTYRRDGGRLLVVMNRDERWGRAAEVPPRIVGDNPSWMAPADGEKGGTWIGVNGLGTVACLLNAYVPGDLELLGREDVPSRGGIIPLLLETELDDIESWMRDELTVQRFPSFSLLIWSSKGDQRVDWRLDQGMTCVPLDAGDWRMASSSAWRTNEVLSWRVALFETWRREGAPFQGLLPQFNLLEVEGREAWSPFVTRSFSATRSVTRVEVDGCDARAELQWWPRCGRKTIAREPSACLDLRLAERTA